MTKDYLIIVNMDAFSSQRITLYFTKKVKDETQKSTGGGFPIFPASEHKTKTILPNQMLRGMKR